MNTKIDLKSALLGLALAVLAVIALGAAPASTQVGRYKLFGSMPYFLLVDSVTGQVWTSNFQNGTKGTDPDFFSPKEK